jgi:hypothetical protein
MIAKSTVGPNRRATSPIQSASITNPGSKANRTTDWVLWGAMVGISVFLLAQLPNPTPAFANPRLLIVHLLAVVPLATCIGSCLKIRPGIARWIAMVSVLWIASLEISLSWLSNLLIPLDLGLSGRWFLRTCIASLIILPWAISAPIASSSIALQRWILALILACVPTFIYSWHHLDHLTKNFSQIDMSRSPKKGMLMLEQILEIDDTIMVSGKPPKQVLLELMQTTQRLEQECDSPISRLSDTARLDRAAKLMALDRHREASELIGQVDEREPDAKLLKIVCARDSENWNAVEELCSSALRDTTSFSKLERMRLHTWLAEALARQRRFQECIEIYRNAIADYPEDATPFRIDMALQLAESGNVTEAIETLKSIQRTSDIQSDPTFLRSIQSMLFRIQSNSCSLRKLGSIPD